MLRGYRMKRPAQDVNVVLKAVAQWIEAFAAEESGATAIEYALIATGIFLGMVPLIDMMGGNVLAMYSTILGYFSSV